jgi:predicted transcriptional regulator
MIEATDRSTDLLALTADIITAHAANNRISIAELPALIQAVHSSLASLGSAPPVVAEDLTPAVSIRSSIKPDYIVCLEDGKKLKMLKRHLRTSYQMTPDQYRAKWKLPADYPMVAPNYAERRRSLALKIGLGRKGAAEPASDVSVAPAPEKKPRGPAKKKLSIATKD